MLDREKILNGLVCCLAIITKCNECPYRGCNGCQQVMQRDAYALLVMDEKNLESNEELIEQQKQEILELGGEIKYA